MRKTNLKFLYSRALIALLLMTVASNSANAEPIRFEHHDFREALKQARENELPIIVHFYTHWCGPCKTMDQAVFKSDQLKDALAGKIVLVKVDAEQSTELASMYQVNEYPTDIYVDPDGRVLGKTSGGISLGNYISNALQVADRYQQSKRLLESRKEAGNDPQPTASTQVHLGPSAPFPRELMEPFGSEYQSEYQTENEQSVPDPRGNSVEEAEEKQDLVFVAIDGYCPVQLNEDRAWVRGNKRWVVEYRDQIYRFSGAYQRDQFDADPEQYAPQLLGCDPVVMWESDRAIPGSTEFAAYYSEKLYLFTSEENRDLFQLDPERYTATKHVLAPRYIEAILIR